MLSNDSINAIIVAHCSNFSNNVFNMKHTSSFSFAVVAAAFIFVGVGCTNSSDIKEVTRLRAEVEAERQAAAQQLEPTTAPTPAIAPAVSSDGTYCGGPIAGICYKISFTNKTVLGLFKGTELDEFLLVKKTDTEFYFSSTEVNMMTTIKIIDSNTLELKNFITGSTAVSSDVQIWKRQ